MLVKGQSSILNELSQEAFILQFERKQIDFRIELLGLNCNNWSVYLSRGTRNDGISTEINSNSHLKNVKKKKSVPIVNNKIVKNLNKIWHIDNMCRDDAGG